MNIIFRVDSSLQIGTGHVMRCLTLADELRNHGARITFICREHKGNLCDFIEKKGFTVFRLPVPSGEQEKMTWNNHAHWLGASREQDALETIEVIKKRGHDIDWLVVDHYALDRNWEQLLRPLVGKIMVIDDLADRPHDCDVLLDQNFYSNLHGRYEGLVPHHCQKLLGPKYALLRPEFRAVRSRPRARDGYVRRVLVFLSGVDPTNETTKALYAIQLLERPNIAIDVVIGSGNPHRKQIEELCNTLPNCRLFCQVSNMAELIAEADLSIVAGGTVTWERFALGCPGVVISVASNQKKIAEDLARCGYQLFLGPCSDVTVSILHASLQTLLQASNLLEMYSLKGPALVDGKGVERVIHCLFPPHIVLRKAKSEDCEDIYLWRNSEETRRHIFETDVIPFEVHKQWFVRTLQNKNRELLIGEVSGRPVGVIRYDLLEEKAIISIYLVPGGQPYGTGTQLIRVGSKWLRQACPQVKVIHAEVLAQNIASQKAFKNAGYVCRHITFEKFLTNE